MVLSKREAGRRYIPHHEAGYRQPAEAFKGLHDSLRILEDDALVASELAEKFWAEVPGIYVRIESL